MLKHFSSERGLSLLSFPLVLASLIVVVLGSIQPAKAGGGLVVLTPVVATVVVLPTAIFFAAVVVILAQLPRFAA